MGGMVTDITAIPMATATTAGVMSAPMEAIMTGMTVMMVRAMGRVVGNEIVSAHLGGSLGEASSARPVRRSGTRVMALTGVPVLDAFLCHSYKIWAS